MKNKITINQYNIEAVPLEEKDFKEGNKEEMKMEDLRGLQEEFFLKKLKEELNQGKKMHVVEEFMQKFLQELYSLNKELQTPEFCASIVEDMFKIFDKGRWEYKDANGEVMFYDFVISIVMKGIKYQIDKATKNEDFEKINKNIKLLFVDRPNYDKRDSLIKETQDKKEEVEYLSFKKRFEEEYEYVHFKNRIEEKLLKIVVFEENRVALLNDKERREYNVKEKIYLEKLSFLKQEEIWKKEQIRQAKSERGILGNVNGERKYLFNWDLKALENNLILLKKHIEETEQEYKKVKNNKEN